MLLLLRMILFDEIEMSLGSHLQLRICGIFRVWCGLWLWLNRLTHGFVCFEIWFESICVQATEKSKAKQSFSIQILKILFDK